MSVENINQKSTTTEEKNKKPRPFFYWIYLVLFIGILFYYFLPGKSTGKQEITWQHFKQDILLTHDVDKVNVINKVLKFTLRKRVFKKKNTKPLPRIFSVI